MVIIVNGEKDLNEFEQLLNTSKIVSEDVSIRDLGDDRFKVDGYIVTDQSRIHVMDSETYVNFYNYMSSCANNIFNLN